MQHPNDWPVAGPIDLAVHDLPHRSSTTEWWYVNAHVETNDGLAASVFAAFFRVAHRRHPETGEVDYGHSLTWAITDMSGARYLSQSWVDQRAPEIGLERLDRGQGSKDERLNRAMREVLEKGRIPEPDRILETEPHIGTTRLELEFGDAGFRKLDDGTYALRLHHDRDNAGCELIFKPQKEPVRHGVDGLVRGAHGEDMFYYFVPRCTVAGTLTLDGLPREVVVGSGWYDHEFGGHRAPEGETGGPSSPGVSDANDACPDEPGAFEHEETDIAWNWTAIQLRDGTDISAYTMVDADRGEIHGDGLILVGPDGEAARHDDVDFEPTAIWRSTRTFFDYPVVWHLRSKSAAVDLRIEAELDDQELMTVMSKPSFWEGRCRVSGTVAGHEVEGLAYVERSGFEPLKTLDDFFGAVGEEVRASVDSHLPRHPTYEQTRDMIASPERPQYMEGVDREALARAMADPVRLITDRGGKSWRSYAALACCDVVGGDSRKWVRWLAMPEFMHVGSLIVDDVQDRSEVRRGGPACHVVYGDALAINAGTACYFMGQQLLFGDRVSDRDKLRLYDLYFEALRAGHAGQAIDLDPKTDLVQSTVVSGDGRELEARILACHRLKTAAPAAALARMGAVAGGGSEAQIEAVGAFFEALGLAFQIMDDVLNIRGFKGDLKTRGEDVRNGTITLPVAKAMSRLDADLRRWLATTLAAESSEDDVARAVGLLESCGAVDDCAEQARSLVETAWRSHEHRLVDSFPKLMLRAFGWYVLERHY